MTEINNFKSMTTIDDIGQFIEFMGKSEKRALKSQLIRLMSHVIKWKSQPARRSASWSITIFSARREIDQIRADVPSLNQDYIESIWPNCFQIAVKNAEDEMGKQSEITSLSWGEVFETEYTWVKPD